MAGGITRLVLFLVAAPLIAANDAATEHATEETAGHTALPEHGDAAVPHETAPAHETDPADHGDVVSHDIETTAEHGEAVSHDSAATHEMTPPMVDEAAAHGTAAAHEADPAEHVTTASHDGAAAHETSPAEHAASPVEHGDAGEHGAAAEAKATESGAHMVESDVGNAAGRAATVGHGTGMVASDAAPHAAHTSGHPSSTYRYDPKSRVDPFDELSVEVSKWLKDPHANGINRKDDGWQGWFCNCMENGYIESWYQMAPALYILDQCSAEKGLVLRTGHMQDRYIEPLVATFSCDMLKLMTYCFSFTCPECLEHWGGHCAAAHYTVNACDVDCSGATKRDIPLLALAAAAFAAMLTVHW